MATTGTGGKTEGILSKLDFHFDAYKADLAYKKFEASAAQLAKSESDRPHKFRSLAKSAREFLVTLFPITELEPLTRPSRNQTG
jgi:hypothetical protein